MIIKLPVAVEDVVSGMKTPFVWEGCQSVFFINRSF